MFNIDKLIMLSMIPGKEMNKCARDITLVNKNAPVVATTSWWLQFSAQVMA